MVLSYDGDGHETEHAEARRGGVGAPPRWLGISRLSHSRARAALRVERHGRGARHHHRIADGGTREGGFGPRGGSDETRTAAPYPRTRRPRRPEGTSGGGAGRSR